MNTYLTRGSNAPGTRRHSGFTLIELLVVVTIISIIAVLITPMIGKAREAGRNAACKGNLKQIGSAFLMFAADHRDVLPGVDDKIGYAQWQHQWLGSEVVPEGETATWCESDHLGTISTYLNLSREGAGRLYRCPSLKKSPPGGGGSNGMFDYTFVQAFAGADLTAIPLTTMVFQGGTDEVRIATPVLVEEDPENGANQSPIQTGFVGTDRIGSWHDSHGNYFAIDGSVQDIDAEGLPEDKGPMIKDFRIELPGDIFVSIWQDSIDYGEWYRRD